MHIIVFDFYKSRLERSSRGNAMVEIGFFPLVNCLASPKFSKNLAPNPKYRYSAFSKCFQLFQVSLSSKHQFQGNQHKQCLTSGSEEFENQLLGIGECGESVSILQITVPRAYHAFKSPIIHQTRANRTKRL